MSDLTVSSILGFEPHQFTTELSNNIDKNLVNHVDRFKKDVKKLITSKGHKDFNEAELDKAAEKLLDKMRQQFHRNMDKFDIYCSRNIFIPASSPPSSSSSTVFNKVESLDSISSKLEELREKYVSLRIQYNDLSTSTKIAALQYEDIRAALFQIRVGGQVLDEYNVQPLAETMATLKQQKVALQEFCVKAQELTDKMEAAISPRIDSSSISSQSNISNNDKIITKGDIESLTKALKNNIPKN